MHYVNSKYTVYGVYYRCRETYIRQRGEIKMANRNGFTEIQLRNRAKKFMELQAEIKALQDQQDALKAELKADLEAKGIESAQAGQWTVHFQTAASNRFDTRAFKSDHRDLYDMYFKVGTTKKFWVA